MAKTPLRPQRWQPPKNVGRRGPFSPNSALDPLDVIPLPGSGPEDVAVDESGRVYTGTREGYVLRISPDGRTVDRIAQTGGRPKLTVWSQAAAFLPCLEYRIGLLPVGACLLGKQPLHHRYRVLRRGGG